jgi:hypothetical protein
VRTWRRAFTDERCGHCRKPIAIGDPLLELHITAIKSPKLRCPTCAGYPPPDDLPPLVERVPIPVTPMAHIRTGADALPFDFKARAAGEREPGEEG